MSSLFTNFNFWFDFTIGYMLTNPRNLPFYHRRMHETYGPRYCTEEQFQKYWHDVSES